MKIVFYVTGNLVAENLLVAANAVARSHLKCEIEILIDDELLVQNQVSIDSSARINPLKDNIDLDAGDMFITGMMWPGFKERRLIDHAKKKGAVSVVIFADICGDAKKFLSGPGCILPDFICVSDRFTYSNLLNSGIPRRLLVPAGSLYLDSLVRENVYRQPDCQSVDIGYLSVPNKSDFLMWGREQHYCEVDIAKDVKEATCLIGAKLVVRKHPKERNSPKYSALEDDGLKVEEAEKMPIIGFIRRFSAVVSSYSTAILLAPMMNRRAISYQPHCRDPVRGLLYKEIGIPVVSSFEDLKRQLSDKDGDIKGKDLNKVLFNVRESEDYFISFVERAV